MQNIVTSKNISNEVHKYIKRIEKHICIFP